MCDWDDDDEDFFDEQTRRALEKSTFEQRKTESEVSQPDKRNTGVNETHSRIPKPSGAAQGRGRSRHQQWHTQQSYTLFVANLPKPMYEIQLEDLFEPFGRIKRVFVQQRNPQQATTFGFVEFERAHEAEKAMVALNKSNYKDKVIRVEMSQNPKETKDMNDKIRQTQNQRDKHKKALVAQDEENLWYLIDTYSYLLEQNARDPDAPSLMDLGEFLKCVNHAPNSLVPPFKVCHNSIDMDLGELQQSFAECLVEEEKRDFEGYDRDNQKKGQDVSDSPKVQTTQQTLGTSFGRGKKLLQS